MPILAQLDSILVNPSWEVLLYLFLFVSLLFYTMYFKKGKIIALFLSLYVAIFSFINFPYLKFSFIDTFNSFEYLSYNVAIFIVFVVVFYVLFIKIGIPESSLSKSRWYESVLFSVLGTGLVMSFFLHFFKVDFIYEFSDFSKYLFSSNDLFFWWIIAPFLAFFFFKR
ncbi:MAG: hypothetical protein COU71_01545 [Parcubacteria group bacterium CG10_big_fil_rev_8_21_14_0_10_38_31]|nr:MAG: hypothetical protein COU71_01545 [Parcubacteria group bacterium CG10_big_fil_rev_8_21_14_0_10_38_31]